MKLAGFLALEGIKGETRKVVHLHIATNRAEEDHVACGVIGTFGKRVRGVEDGYLATCEKTVEATQNHEGQNDFTVFGLLEVAAQNFGDRPYKST
ncbi:hypothetical protein GCM10017621_27200 [Maricaulis virginensis]|uniref:Uncharacterized protein n=1 Tax=Maricaulis virginensis TaxID=144022 RepID=A0A9W6IPE2_9PROT|nr:hypothetical protein GCM10017621_27200 [Maricaulis virginensis]